MSEFEFDPADSQIVGDLEPREIAGVMVDDCIPDDIRLGKVSVSGGGLGLSADMDHPVDDLAPLKATTEELRGLAGVEAELDQRQPEIKVDPSLEQVGMLMDILDYSGRATPVIYIVDMNGRTSTVHAIESLVRALGHRTGRTISPHLQLVTERIAIDGQPIHPRDYVCIWREIRPYVEMVDAKSAEKGGPQTSKFEILTAMAYATFADTPADIAVVEVSMGDTWDATSVVEVDMAAIHPIGLGHTEHFGDTLVEIASRKVGIIKSRWSKDDSLTPPDSVVIVGGQEPEAMDVVLHRTMKMDAFVARAGVEYGVVSHQLAIGGQNLTLRGLVGECGDIHLPLHGPHRARSAATTLVAVEVFFGVSPGRPFNTDTARRGFAAVASPGCLERVRSIPTVFIDAAHNPHGARALRTALSAEFDFRRIIGVLSVLGEEDARGLLIELESYFEEVVITQNTSPRALHYDDLADLVEETFGEKRVYRVPILSSAARLAVALAGETDTGDGIVSGSGVVVAGSVVTAGEARTLSGKDPQ